MEVAPHFTSAQLKLKQRDATNIDHWQRFQMVILARLGWTAPAIAAAVNRSRRVVQSWVYSYNEHGLEGLNDGRGADEQPTLTAEQEQQFRERVAAGPQPEDKVCTLRGRDYKRILEQEFGVLRSLSATYVLLHKLDYSCLRPRPKHRKADPAKQQAFLDSLPTKMAEIAARHPTKKLRVMFQDEARFGQQGTTTNVWAPTGSRPPMVRQTEYKYLWLMGAVCPETGFAEGLICPRLDVNHVNKFLEQLSERIPADEHVALFWDGAGFHQSGKVKMPANITAIRLPAYSPELNPIENLWHYLKSHYWSNRVYDGYDAMEEAIEASWRDAVLVPELMKTVCAATIYTRANALV